MSTFIFSGMGARFPVCLSQPGDKVQLAGCLRQTKNMSGIYHVCIPVKPAPCKASSVLASLSLTLPSMSSQLKATDGGDGGGGLSCFFLWWWWLWGQVFAQDFFHDTLEVSSIPGLPSCHYIFFWTDTVDQ